LSVRDRSLVTIVALAATGDDSMGSCAADSRAV
jgi:alkylhydroperoxidase/carboxymuconolactone decarboxylase family protein YurZ